MPEEYNPDIISLSDESGKEFKFEVVDAIETDEHKYIALLPTVEDPQKALEESGDLVIMKVIEEGEEIYYEEIEDDEEYENVAGTFVERLSDMFEIEED